MKPETIRQRNKAWWDAIMVSVPRAADQTYSPEDLLRVAADVIPRDDPDKHHAIKVKNFVHEVSHPGALETDGRQLSLFGDRYDYEPDRPVFGADGRVTEQKYALPQAKIAEARRAREVEAQVHVWADRKTKEAEEFNSWALAQSLLGRPVLELMFGNFVTETGLIV